MKKLLFLVVLALSSNVFALGGFESLSETEQSVLKSIVKQLGVEDPDNIIKKKVYDDVSFAFNGNWGSYWTGLNELASSKYANGAEKGYIEVAVNNSENGTIFLSFLYKNETKQIVVFKKQIRHGSRDFFLSEFEKRKSDKEKYEVKHESDNYALLQEKGKVNFEFYHVNTGSQTVSLVYQSQSTIDL